ncbi:MAG: hypothetical protein HY549_07900, partial [Elusimicrobia bacterium]|nr:hypothetical protein [Elusimicrobiota bacterium]
LFAGVQEMAKDARLGYHLGVLNQLGANLIGPSLYFLTQALLNRVERARRWILLNFAVGLLFCVLAYHPAFISREVHIRPWGAFPQVGALYYFFLVHFAGLLGISLSQMWKAYRGAETLKERNRHKYFVAGLAIAYLAALDYLPSFGVAMPRIGGFPILLWIALTAYAVVLHKLLDIETVALRTLIWLGSSLFALVPVVLALRQLSPRLAEMSFAVAAGALSALLIAFDLYWRWVQASIDQIFQKRRYDLRQLLAETLSEFSALRSLEELGARLQQIAVDRLFVEHFAFYVARADASGFRLLTCTESRSQPREVASDHPLVRKLRGLDSVTGWEELGVAWPDQPRLLVPLQGPQGLLGWFVLGRKATGQSYGAQERDFLDELHRGLAVAVSNSLLFEQVRSFNERLEATVRERTKELAEANDRLRGMDKAKTEFLSIASHELRAPLTAIYGFLTIMQERPSQLPESKSREYIDMMHAESSRMVRLINDLLDITKIELGHFEVLKAPAKLLPIVNKVCEEMRVTFPALAFRVVGGYGEDDLVASVDPDKIGQVLLNLAGNAAKYSPEKGEVLFRVEKGDGEVLLSVEDQGPGIPPEHRERIFEKFYRIEKAENRQGPKGTGLGLTIARSIVEMHGGRIWVESESGRGSRFRFSLSTETTRN